MTTIATNIVENHDAATIFYDGECRLCTATARRFEATLRARGFELRPLQGPGVARLLGVGDEHLLDEVKLLTPDGHVRGGVDAILHVARHIWWAVPIWLISFIPGIRPILRYLYRRLVPYRYCVAGRCGQPSPLASAIHRVVAWLPLILLPFVVIAMGNDLPPWAFMWLMAGAIFFACKWLTWRLAPAAVPSDRLRSLAYLLLWPGMDAERFLDKRHAAPSLSRSRWIGAMIKTTLGAVLTWLAITIADSNSQVAAWIWLIGLVMLLHFGVFDLLSQIWRKVGIDAPPIMNRPVRAMSVGEFWSRRWNCAYNDLSRRFIFEPARACVSAATALVVSFLISGLIHELVITLPARGGWGGPTCYFLIQACAILIERNALARRLGLGRGATGRVVVAVTTLGPLPLLFPAAFRDAVIVPFLHQIAAFGNWQILTFDLSLMIRFAGILHFGILLAGALLPLVLDWKNELRRVSLMTRHIIWTHGSFIVLVIVGFALISLIAAPELASGTMLARMICGFIAAFWLIRLFLQFMLFDARQYLSNLPLKIGYHGLTIVFAIFVLTYSWAAVVPQVRLVN